MSGGDKVFAGSIPEFYDTYLVPLIFEEFAKDLASRIAETSPRNVLEVAAGSGVVTRALAPILDGNVSYVVTDLNQPMLDHAQSKQAKDERISWEQADALNLPYDDNIFDAVLCQFGVMFFPDRIAGYKEAKRVLAKGGGRYIFNVWDEISANEFANCVTQAVGKVFPEDPPMFLARTPHGYYDLDVIREDLEAAGFTKITTATLEVDSVASAPNIPALAYCQGTPLRNEIETRDPDSLKYVTEQAAQEIAEKFGADEVLGKIRGHIITAS